MSAPSLSERTILCFESRLSDVAGSLIEKYGGRALLAPAMQEVPLEEHSAVFAFAGRLLAGDVDILICMTGVGTRMMVDAMATRFDRDRIVAALDRVFIVSRGPKPAAALREIGLSADLKVPEPNTWQEVLDAVDASEVIRPLDGKLVAVQEYGKTNDELVAGLRNRGLQVYQVPIYRWTLPDDLSPLRTALEVLVSGDVDIVIFTSRTQMDHVMQFAGEHAREDEVRQAYGRTFVASIGPVCSRGLREHGVEPDFEPSRPKLGVMVRELAQLEW